jgi:two-component system sensor histidine kinase AgrC
MIQSIIAFSRYLCILIFGTEAAVSAAGMARTKKNYFVLGCITAVLFVIQVICLLTWGLQFTEKIYPLLSHFPVAIFTVLYLKKSWMISLTSMFVSLLLCQIPRWVGTFAGSIFHSVSANHIAYILVACILYFVLRKYVFKSVQHMLERSVKSCLMFGAIPAFYYIYVYGATIYTDFMYRGSRVAVQFFPFVTSIFYFAFVLIYYEESQRQARIQRERDMLETQLKLAQTEFDSMRQMQQNASAYRHDMRHHLALLQSLAYEERIDEIKDYLRTAQSDMDAITPVRFCENETVNLILSAFSAKAKQSDIQLTIDAKLPHYLKLSDTELCSLLSNALENAIHACEGIADKNERQIKLRVFSKNYKLCIDIRNKYNSEPILNQGLPVPNKLGHGFGTKSMAHIVEKHGGVYQFSIKDGWFIFQSTT